MKLNNNININLSQIVDDEGHYRFVEGELATTTKEGISFSYAKWSLSGTHLMIVLDGTIANGTSMTNDDTLAWVNLPSFITDKIYTVWGINIEIKSIPLMGSDWTSQLASLLIRKLDGQMQIMNVSTYTTDKDRNFRLQFDLMID